MEEKNITLPNFKSDLEIQAFENIHIYPLICELLEIKPYSGVDAADGDIQVLQHILQNQRQ